MKKILAVASLIVMSAGVILQPSLADDGQTSMQQRIQDTLSRYEQVKSPDEYVDDSDLS